MKFTKTILIVAFLALSCKRALPSAGTRNRTITKQKTNPNQRQRQKVRPNWKNLLRQGL